MCLLNIVTTFPVVNHHAEPHFVTTIIVFFILALKFSECLLGICKSFQCLLRHIAYLLPFTIIAFCFLLLLNQLGNFLDINACLLHYFLMTALKFDFQHFHQGTTLLHLNIEALNVTK